MTNASNRTALPWAGIDVAKATFEAALHPAWVRGKEIPLAELPGANFRRTAGGVARLLAWLDGMQAPVGVCAVMETTGRYSVELAKLLLAARPSLAPAIVDAKSASHFARSLRLRNKTDRVDAATLARLGRGASPEPRREDASPRTPRGGFGVPARRFAAGPFVEAFALLAHRCRIARRTKNQGPGRAGGTWTVDEADSSMAPPVHRPCSPWGPCSPFRSVAVALRSGSRDVARSSRR